jgi:hypothetical protein
MQTSGRVARTCAHGEAPYLFHHAGLGILVVSWVLLMTGWLVGLVKIGFASVFGLHTMMFAMLGSVFGLSLWGTGMLLSVRIPSDLPLYDVLLDLDEGRLFWATAAFLALSLAFFAAIGARWARNDFVYLDLERETLLLTAFGADGIMLVTQVLTARLMKSIEVRSNDPQA